MKDKITFTEGDGLKIFYKNGIYYKHQITNQYEYTREIK
jgi:hypothetical protein